MEGFIWTFLLLGLIFCGTGILVLVVTHGRNAIYFDPHSRWTGATIEALLARNGIQISLRNPAGLGGPPDSFFYVANEDYETALALLAMAGVPLNYVDTDSIRRSAPEILTAGQLQSIWAGSHPTTTGSRLAALITWLSDQ